MLVYIRSFTLFFILLFTSCSRDSTHQSPSDLIKSRLVVGVWHVGSYTHGGIINSIDDTALFDGYTLKFNSNGTVKAENGSTVVMGNYALSTETVNMYPVNFLKFTFSNSDLFARLNKKWRVYGSFLDETYLIYESDAILKLLQ